MLCSSDGLTTKNACFFADSYSLSLSESIERIEKSNKLSLSKNFRRIAHSLDCLTGKDPNIKNFLRFLVAFCFAFTWMYRYQFEYDIKKALSYTLLWLAITFFRNVLVDLYVVSGLKVQRWKKQHINFDNAFQSVFWTGFSVPLLGIVKCGVDLHLTARQPSLKIELIRFFAIGFINGTYISFHNYLRRFNKKVIRLNFFRSIFAWPLATMFSPVGNAFMVPSIVQAKIWSDTVAAFIEAYGRMK